MKIFGNTFRDLTVSRDSFEFYKPGAHNKTLEDSLLDLASQKVIFLLEIFSARLQAIETEKDEANVRLCQDFRAALEGMQKFVEEEKNRQRAKKNTSGAIYRMFNRIRKANATGLIQPTLDLLIEVTE